MSPDARSSARTPSAAPARVPSPWIAAVAGLAVVLYLNSLGGALLYDDVNAITNNALVRTTDVRGIVTTASWWGEGRGRLWRPLTTLSFTLDHVIHGLDPLGYHAMNVGLHAAVSVLVLVVFRAVTAAAWTALAAALLFASHPVHTEAVASVVGRAELLAAAAFFLAWRCWLAADAARGRPRTAWRLAATAVYFFGMLGKENAIALPAVLMWADVIGRGGASRAALARRRAPDYLPLIVAAAAFVALRRAVVGEITPAPSLLDNPLGVLPTLPRILTAVAVIGRYALRLVFPLRLSADYSYDQIPAVHTPLDLWFVAGITVIVALGVLAAGAARRVPPLALGIGMLALTFAMVANLLFPIGTIMGERLLYLPSAGFCLALAAGLAGLGAERSAAPARAPSVPIAWLALATIVAAYGARTVARNAVWREPLVFFGTMVAEAPRSARAHTELGSALADAGRFDEARVEFERALAITPEDAVILYNWAHALTAEGRWDAAAATYRRAIAAKPDFGEAFENLGNVESARGDQQAALAALRRALELTPESPYLRMTIANVLARAGSPAEARAAYEQALAARPTDPRVLESYAAFLQSQGELAEAAELRSRSTAADAAGRRRAK